MSLNGLHPPHQAAVCMTKIILTEASIAVTISPDDLTNEFPSQAAIIFNNTQQQEVKDTDDALFKERFQKI